MTTQLLTSYSQVVSSNDNDDGNNGNGNAFFQDKDDVNLPDRSMTETLAFKYDFQDEKKAVKEYEDWENTMKEKNEQAETLMKDILGVNSDQNTAGGKRGNAEPPQPERPPRTFNVNNIIPAVSDMSDTIYNTVTSGFGRISNNGGKGNNDNESMNKNNTYGSKANNDPGFDKSKIRQFREYTGATEEKAIEFLKSFDWEVDTAVKHFFDQ